VSNLHCNATFLSSHARSHNSNAASLTQTHTPAAQWVAAERDPETNALTWETTRFPSGIPSLTKWLHAKGLKFGLYSSMGTTTCNNKGRTWPGLKNGTWPRHGSYDHYQEDAAAFAAWGVDYVKMDW
jgi:alpha-galactosidase